MKRKRQSIYRGFFYTFIFIALLATGIPFYLWIQYLVMDIKTHASSVRENYMKSQKMLLKSQVDNLIETVEIQKADAEIILKKEIKERVYEAHKTASLIYEKNHNKVSTEELYTLIHDALWYREWDNGTGYIFAEYLNGVEYINRNNSELEGKNIINLQDDKGTYLVKDIINTAKTKGEGYCTYYWNVPGTPGVFTKKISFVKIFKPLGIVIGSGKYLEQVEEKIKKEVVAVISRIEFGDGGYFFAGQWDGLSLSGPSVGKNMYNIEDPNGVKIVQELINVSKKGGGFVEYVMPRLEGYRPSPKLSYANAVKDWNWYIGAGKYVDEIEEFIMESEAKNNKAIYKAVRNILVLYLIIVLSGLILIKWFSEKIDRNISVFKKAFRTADIGKGYINSDLISFSEFYEIAESAERMFARQERADKALEESEEKFKELIENAHIPIMIMDSLGNIVYLNSEFSKLFGYQIEDIPTKEKWIDLACTEEIQVGKIKNYCQALFDFTQDVEADNQLNIYCKNKTEIKTIDVASSVIGDRVLFTLIDITERLNTEKEKKLLEQQKNRYQKMKAIGLMAGSVAHDLNNILSGIVGYPEVILADMEKDNPIYKPLQLIKESAFRASAVVADLLTVARGVASKKETADLNVIIKDFLKSPEYLKIKSGHPGIKVTTKIDKNLSPVLCSQIHIKKTLMNLLSNAFEAIDNKGQIEITTLNIIFDKNVKTYKDIKAGEYSMFSVADNGKGVSNDDLDRIFEPFYSKKVMGRSGTGLGLSIVWNTVEDHNGFIDVKSSSKGSCFTVYLPSSREKVEEKIEVPIKDFSGNGESVLIIDDEEGQRTISAALLEKLNYKPHAVSSGEEALEYLNKEKYDVILLDMIMGSGMNGYETYKQILEIHNSQKAVIASGFAKTDDVEKALALGNCEFISKPYTLQTLGSAIKKVIARAYSE